MLATRSIKVTALLLAAAVLLWAATARVAPSSDVDIGGFSATPLWEKISENIDSPDGVVITSGNNPSALVSFGVTCPADVDTITEANLRIRARQNDVGRNISANVSWSASSATDFNTGTLNKTALQNYQSGAVTVSVNKTACNASTLMFTPTTTGTGPAAVMTVDTFNLEITYTAGAARKRTVVIASAKHGGIEQ